MIKEIRCSTLHRPMQCLGFLSIENTVYVEAGQPAKDGTAVGELLSEMIRQRTIKPEIGPTASNGTFLDDDMWFHARSVYNHILDRAGSMTIETEERIDWMTPAGIVIRGQFDISFVVGETLHIEDLKYGFGLVEVKENWQLIGYAIGQVERLKKLHNFVPSHISFTIHQPRAYHEDGPTRTHVIKLEELNEYFVRIADRMSAYVAGDKTLVTGPACKYCPGASACPALNRSTNEAIDTVLSEWDEKPLTNDEVAEQIALLQRANELLGIRLKSVEQLAISRIQNSQIIPGYSFEMTFGHRKWNTGVTPQTIEMFTGVKATEEVMLSPAKIEKLGVKRELTNQLSSKAQTGLKLVKKDIEAEANKMLPKPF